MLSAGLRGVCSPRGCAAPPRRRARPPQPRARALPSRGSPPQSLERKPEPEPEANPFLWPSLTVPTREVPHCSTPPVQLRSVLRNLLAEHAALLKAPQWTLLAVTLSMKADNEGDDDAATAVNTPAAAESAALLRRVLRRAAASGPAAAGVSRGAELDGGVEEHGGWAQEERQRRLVISSTLQPSSPLEVVRSLDGVECLSGATVSLESLHLHLCVLGGRLALLQWDQFSEQLIVVEFGAPWTGRPLGTVVPERHGLDLRDIGYIGGELAEHASAQSLLRLAERTQNAGDTSSLSPSASLSPKPLGDASASTSQLKPLRRRPPSAAAEWGGSRLLGAVANPQLRSSAAFARPTALSDAVPINAGQRAALDRLAFNIEAIQGPPGTGKSTLVFHLISSYLPATEVALATCVTNKAVDSIAEKLAAARLPFFVFGSSLRLGLVARRWTLDAQTDRDERVVIATARLAKPLRARQKLVSREERLKRIAAAAGARAKALQLVALFGASAQQPAPWTLSGALLPRLTAIVDRLMRELDEVRSEVSAELVLAARAVLGTVATASGSLLSDERAAPAVAKITTCVLDEAGACGESKLPLLLRLPLERIVAIGDQQQLKPFARADRPPLGFFQRLLMALPHDAVPCLATQYRMHPAIAEFVSARFYRNIVITPESVAIERLAACPHGLVWVQYGGGEEEVPSDRSWENAREAEIVAQVLSALRASSTVGKAVMVVTFYKAQQRLLRDVLALHGFTERVDDDGVGGPRLRIVTVDQAQGSEADVVVLSCVRSNRRRITGFVGTRSSPNRFNVAITRARDRLVVVGDYATLSVDSVWGALHRAAMKLSADELPPLPPPPPA